MLFRIEYMPQFYIYNDNFFLLLIWDKENSILKTFHSSKQTNRLYPNRNSFFFVCFCKSIWYCTIEWDTRFYFVCVYFIKYFILIAFHWNRDEKKLFKFYIYKYNIILKQFSFAAQLFKNMQANVRIKNRASLYSYHR